jgi:hypothetical protein
LSPSIKVSHPGPPGLAHPKAVTAMTSSVVLIAIKCFMTPPLGDFDKFRVGLQGRVPESVTCLRPHAGSRPSFIYCPAQDAPPGP